MNPVILDALQQRFGTADWTQYQVIRGQKYDFIRCPNLGTNQLSFFSIPIGGVDPNSQLAKTLEQTNLVKNASFGQEYFAITQIRTYAGFLPKARQNGTIATDVNSVWNGYSASDANAVEALNNLFNRGILNVSFAQKLYYQIQQPLKSAPAGFGVEIQQYGQARQASVVSAKQAPWVQGDWRFDQVYNLDPIQLVEPEVQLAVTMDFPDLNSPDFTGTWRETGNVNSVNPNVEVGVIFDGYVIRPLQ